MGKTIKSFINKLNITEKAKVLAVASAEDEEVLLSIKHAVDDNVVIPMLFGDAYKIEEKLKKLNLNFDNVQIVDCSSHEHAAKYATESVAQGTADILMKGQIQTSTFMKAALNKEWGLNDNRLISQASLMISSIQEKCFLLTDCGINIAPDLMAKKAIAENAIDIAYKLGSNVPIVVPVCAVETVNQKMPATVDAAILSKMAERGQMKRCIVDGPLALDNALFADMAKHKGITSPYAGAADIILAPNIEAGNILYKALAYLANTSIASIISGAKAPIVVTSRSDCAETKYNSILLAAAMTS